MKKDIEETKVDPKTVVLQSKVDESSTTTTAAGPGGRVGLAGQQPNANSAASLPTGGGGGSQSEETQTKTDQVLAASHGRTTTQMAGLTPKRVTISIGVPSTYFEKIWLQRNPPAAGAEPKKPDATELAAVQDEELKKIREAILPLIPKPTDSATPVDVNQLLNVTAHAPVSMPAPVGPSFVEQALVWLQQSWSSVAMVGLALIALMMLRSFVAAVPPAPEMPSLLSTTVGDEEEAAAVSATAGGEGKDGTKPKQRTLQRKAGSGANLREELVDMVREDPDAAANILRGWIGNAT
jgi:flagellar M-ring protein FliF